MRLVLLMACLPVAVVIVACQDSTAPITSDAGTPPQLAIADGAHGGNSHFYFLPPMVSPPRPTGTFDPGVSPTVDICRLPSCASAIATFTTGSGPGQISVDVDEEVYRVNWHTKGAGLAPATAVRIRVLAGRVVLGYVDVYVLPQRGRLAEAPSNMVPLREGHPLLIKFRIEEGAVGVEPEKPLKLAFISNRANPTVTERLYVMDADGGNVVQVTQVGRVYGFAWSPDGRKFAFTRNVGTLNWLPNIFLINADGTGETRLTTQPGQNPVWSPDGRKLAFSSVDDPGNSEIFVINADGTDLTNITNNPAQDGGAEWSPDGTKIAFLRDFAFSPEVFVMNADGTGQTRLTDDFRLDLSPVWSPDGSKLAFSREWAEGSAPWTGNIWIINPDGSGAINLTDFTERAATAPAWSPSGNKIAFTGGDPDFHDIYTINRDGTGLFNVTNSATNESGPAWAPDGSMIAFTTLKDNHTEIFTIRPDGTDLRNVTNNPDDDGGWGYAWKPLSR